MELNYLAFFLISFIPLAIGYLWYNPKSIILKKLSQPTVAKSYSVKSIIILFILSVAIVYGYMNLTIHQLGFYDLFFTDIMLGKIESQIIVDDFLATYGEKHRHFGHGILHGFINAFLFAAPILGGITIIENKDRNYFMYHFLYWLLVSIVIGGCISSFV